ncbi:MAG: OmpH family outer membrane protein [Cyclobacteriaceae bacterium]|nr:OmpH family outer membrane protein [Cyclobacteriaceae bacterium]
MKLKYLVLFFINMLVTVGVVVLILNYQRTKIAYIHSQELIYDYAGTMEAMAEFNNEKLKWQANIDTLNTNFEYNVEEYRNEYSNLNKIQRVKVEKRLSSQENQLQGYRDAIAKKAEEQERVLLEGVVNQINSFVKTYGEENGYKIILGTNQSGNIMYAEQTLDITKEIIEAMNKNYRGE